MIKTSTKQNDLKEQQEEVPGPQQDDLFYQSIKHEMDKLMQDPSAETVENILAFSRKN